MPSLDSPVAGTVILKPKRAQPFFGKHPWVFLGAIDRIEGDPQDGAVVDLHSSAGNFIARGFLNTKSKIQVRLYSWDAAVALNLDFFLERARTAIRLRHDILKLNSGPNSAYRVIFSEADGLSGMVVDRYGDWLSVQFTSLALIQRGDAIVEMLVAELGCKGAYLRTEKGIGKMEGVIVEDGLICGEMPPPELIIEENGLQFAVNLSEGQKTGYYLDQRDNRTAVARYCSGKRMLDAFSYSGGFGIYAARAGATEVTCVDSSDGALALAQRNAELNGCTQLTCEKGDVFNTLDGYGKQNRKFDVIVLDPPKFARNRGAVDDALRGYRRLYEVGIRLLNPDGILVLCCCTGLVTMDQLEEVISQVSVKSRRDVQILERRGSAADHPVSASCREGAYLKCLITRVS